MVENWDQHAVFKLVHSDDADLFAQEVTDAYRQGFRLVGNNPLVVCPVKEGGRAHCIVLMVKYHQKEER